MAKKDLKEVLTGATDPEGVGEAPGDDAPAPTAAEPTEAQLRAQLASTEAGRKLLEQLAGKPSRKPRAPVDPKTKTNTHWTIRVHAGRNLLVEYHLRSPDEPLTADEAWQQFLTESGRDEALLTEQGHTFAVTPLTIE